MPRLAWAVGVAALFTFNLRAVALEVDASPAEFLKILGKNLAGDLAVGDTAYINMGWGWLCTTDGEVVLPADFPLTTKSSTTAAKLTVIPGQQVTIETPLIDIEQDYVLYNFVFPTCQNLRESGIIASEHFFHIKSIDGAASLKGWAEIVAKRKKP